MQINNNGITNNTANGSANTQKTSASAKAESNVNTGDTGDSVELSQAARVLTELESKIVASADVDVTRVENIRQAIADGNYSIDAESIASKMLAGDELF